MNKDTDIETAAEGDKSALNSLVSWMYLDVFEWRENLSIIGCMILIPLAVAVLSVWRPFIFTVRLLITIAILPIAMFIELCAKDKLWNTSEYIDCAIDFVINGLN